MSGSAKKPTRKGTTTNEEERTCLRVVEREDAAELPELSDEMRLALTEMVDVAREGLLAMSVGVGLRVFAEMMQDELTAKVGAKHAKVARRTASRHGSAPGSVV